MIMTSKFITFQNIEIPSNEISHQHLSNWFYYINYVMCEYYHESEKNYIEELINKRFGGMVLPYHPHPKFDMEKRKLKDLGFLMPNGDIIINKTKVGCYENA